MEDEPEVVFEADADALAKAAKLDDFSAVGVGGGRSCCPEEKRAHDADGFEGLAQDAGFKGFDIDGDVWEFGHAVSWLLSQIGAEDIVQRLKTVRRRGDGGKLRTVRSDCATRRAAQKD